MDVPDLVGLFFRPLQSIEIPYMITGGVASVIYGEPRFTRDIDIVLELEEANVEAFAGAFESGDFYVPPIDALRKEAGRLRHGHFNVIHRETALRADVYLRGDDPLHARGFQDPKAGVLRRLRFGASHKGYRSDERYQWRPDRYGRVERVARAARIA